MDKYKILDGCTYLIFISLCIGAIKSFSDGESAGTVLLIFSAVATLAISMTMNNNKMLENEMKQLEKQLSQIYYPLILILSKIKKENNNIQYMNEFEIILNLRSFLDSEDRDYLEKLQDEIKLNFDAIDINSKLNQLKTRKCEIEDKLDNLKKKKRGKKNEFI